MAHRENVDALTARHDLPNPIPHQDVKVKRVEFLDADGASVAMIYGTDMNCASRLWIQDRTSEGETRLVLTSDVRQELKAFFAERWDGAWSATHRPMMYWFANADALRAHYD